MDLSATYGVLYGAARVRFHIEIIFEQGGMRRNTKKDFAEMNEDRNLKNGIRVKIHQFDSVESKQTTKELTGGESKAAIDELLEYHNLARVGCRGGFLEGCPPLDQLSRLEERFIDQLLDLIFTHGGR